MIREFEDSTSQRRKFIQELKFQASFRDSRLDAPAKSDG